MWKWATTALAGQAILTSLCLVPLLQLGLLGGLLTLAGWEHVYSFSKSNLDILVLSWTKIIVMVGLLTGRKPSYKATNLHVIILSSVYHSLVVLKIAAVAVLAPDGLLPDRKAGIDQKPYVGIVYMFCSLCCALVFSVMEAAAAKALIKHQQQQQQQLHDVGTTAADSVTTPLLSVVVGQSHDVPGSKPSHKVDRVKAEKDKKSNSNSNSTVKELLRLSFIDWPIISVAFCAGAAAALAQACIPHLTGQIIDYASIDPDKSKFGKTTMMLVITALVCGVFSGIRGGLFSLAITRLNVRLRTILFQALLKMEVGFYDTVKSGDVTSRLNADTSTVSTQVCLNMNVMLRSATQAAMVMCFMFYASWRLTVVTLILVPIILAISKVYGRYMASLSKKVQAELADANGLAQEVLGSMTTVKAHAAQDSADKMYQEKLREYYNLNVKESAIYSIYACITTFLPNTVSAIVLFYGGCMVLDGKMSPGSLVSFMLYQQSLSGAFSLMGDVFSSLTAAVGAADKVMELIHRKAEVDGGGSLVLHDELQGSIELKDVVFHYPARPDIQVLKGLSLCVKPGEVVALVGASGGGKSSIVKLLQRFYLPQSGCVMFDGRDVGVYDSKWLRRQVALVSQEPTLYARSIKRNIVYGLEEADGVEFLPSDADIEDAAKQANAHDFITAFPDGYETNCGEKGVQMSGGQKQRIAIARALVRKPRVLLLDEATSALDADSEAVVQEALDRMMSSHACTTLVIAHRLSTIQGADRIIVIGNGIVQESGTHDQLLEAKGAYASLVQRQLTRVNTSTVSLAALNGQP